MRSDAGKLSITQQVGHDPPTVQVRRKLFVPPVPYTPQILLPAFVDTCMVAALLLDVPAINQNLD